MFTMKTTMFLIITPRENTNATLESIKKTGITIRVVIMKSRINPLLYPNFEKNFKGNKFDSSHPASNPILLEMMSNRYENMAI